MRLVENPSMGAIAERIEYDEFGNIRSDSAPGTQPFGFAGGLRDVDSGLVRFGLRDYDPVTGRWTAKDPILFDGGATELYEYVGGDPVNRSDPSGRYGLILPPPGPFITPFDPAPQFGGAWNDFWRNYWNMRKANTINADKYFHCMANCEATARGAYGYAASWIFGETREWTDEHFKGDPRWACDEDRAANAQGRKGPSPTCRDTCSPLRTPGVAAGY